MAAPEPSDIDYTPVYLYVQDITSAGSTNVIVNMSESVIKYKTDITITNKNLTYTPDENGLIEMSLPDTDDMTGDIYYNIDFSTSKYRFKVPKTLVDTNFWDLNPQQSTTKEFRHVGC